MQGSGLPIKSLFKYIVKARDVENYVAVIYWGLRFWAKSLTYIFLFNLIDVLIIFSLHDKTDA